MSEKESVEVHESYMTINEDGMLVPDYDMTIKVFDDGDIVTGEVVKVDRDEVLVDIGYKSEGAIPVRELSIRADANPHDIVKVGDHIEALVLQKEDKDGRLILSKKRADYEKSWERIDGISKSGEKISGIVIEVVKGGLILDIGLRGFLPASLVDTKRTKDLHQFMGQDLECKIIEMDRNRNNVVLSRRAVLEEEKKHEKGKILEKIVQGAVLSGKISSIVDFGAFVDLGGIDGLIHISELSWNHIDHPSEVVAVGDDVNVQVLSVELDRERISLGLRQTQEDPWKEKAGKYEVGKIVNGKVTKIVPFGAFIELEEGLEGLIHISELSHRHVEMPEEVVKAGELVDSKIVGIDLDKRRISLSIKQTQDAPVEEKIEAEVVEEVSAEEIVEVTIEVETEVLVEAEVEEPEVAETVEVAEAVELVVAAEEQEAATADAIEDIAEVAAAGEATEVEAEEAVAEDAEIVEHGVAADPDSLEVVLQQMKVKHSKKAPAAE
ncbi:MAG TPA: 30S ribosomal protein S1 [Candidatus Aquicultor sp.]|jgi:small subunit ribosomal protein S1